MALGCRCAPKKSLIVRASKPTARPKPAKPSWSPSGRRNRAMRKANQCATQDRSLIRPAIERAATLDTSPDLSDFAARVQREASRRGFTEAQRPVVLGDGSAWIWNSATELFPQATQILDRFHAKEHLSQVGKIIYGDSPEGKPWIQARYDELDEGCLKSVVQALHGHAGQYKQARECVRYIWNNRRRMQYTKFHKQGFCTSTGVVAAGCKVTLGTRPKLSGMHWTVKGANR